MSSDAVSSHLVALRDSAKSKPPAYLSTVAAGPADRRLALAVVLVSTAIFAAAVPFAKLPLASVPAFIPAYQSALVVNDLMTAVLLFGQFAVLRSRGLLLLAAAYLFTALMAAIHALTFPGLFSPSGLLGAGPQTTAWLYMFWHAGFPLLVIGYALTKFDAPADARPGAAHAVLVCVGAVAAGAAAVAVLVTYGREALPAIMQGNRYTPAMNSVVSSVWLLSVAALAVLWWRRPHSVLDLWLMVVLCAWLFDIALAAVFNAGRFDLGFYAGRVYGLLAASFVLIVLLLETVRLRAQLADDQRIQQRLATQAERLRIVHEIDRAIIGEVKPEAIAAAVLQPLRELLGVPRVVVNLFDLAAGEVEWLAAAGRHRVHVGPGVRYPLRFMGDFEALRRGEPQVIQTNKLPAGPEMDALLASGVHVYMAVPMTAGGELIGALSFGGEAAVFPPEQITIAKQAATQLAIAISQARLFERVKGHAEDLERRVAERTAQLQAANKELESFSYSVSHDLRAPLRAVDGYALMLAEDYAPKLDDEGRRLLGVVRQSAAQMGRLIDDLLHFSQVGRRPLAAAPLDMRSLAANVVSELGPSFTKAKVEVNDLPPAFGDRALLRHVWMNLIGNALKYSARAQAPRVEIGGRADGAESVYWVRDNGAGFDTRYKDKLFNVFQRLHREDEFEGTGVGLAIVQRVVLRHKGRVWAEGALGEGACFSFALPKGGPGNGKS